MLISINCNSVIMTYLLINISIETITSINCNSFIITYLLINILIDTLTSINCNSVIMTYIQINISIDTMTSISCKNFVLNAVTYKQIKAAILNMFTCLWRTPLQTIKRNTFCRTRPLTTCLSSRQFDTRLSSFKAFKHNSWFISSQTTRWQTLPQAFEYDPSGLSILPSNSTLYDSLLYLLI